MPNQTTKSDSSTKRDYPWYILAQIEKPYTYEWWIGLSSRAFYRWTHGDYDSERWQRLDHYLQKRADYCLRDQGICMHCGKPSRLTSMVRWHDRLYCAPCLIAIYPRKRQGVPHE